MQNKMEEFFLQGLCTLQDQLTYRLSPSRLFCIWASLARHLWR